MKAKLSPDKVYVRTLNLIKQRSVMSQISKEKHTNKLKELEDKVNEAKESAGDMEVMDARIEIARFAAKSLDKDTALDAYKQLLELPKISSGKKIDSLMESSRVASFYGDTAKSNEFIESVSSDNMR